MKVLRIKCDFTSRRMTVPKKNQLAECMVIPTEVDVMYVQISDDEIQGQESSFQVVTVKSFKDELVTNKISFNDNYLVSGCACPHMTNNLIICMHMYKTRRIFNYGINFGTRKLDTSIDSPFFSSLPNEPQADRKLIEDNIENVLKIVDLLREKMNFHDVTMFEQSMKHVVRQAKSDDDSWSTTQS